MKNKNINKSLFENSRAAHHPLSNTKKKKSNTHECMDLVTRVGLQRPSLNGPKPRWALIDCRKR